MVEESMPKSEEKIKTSERKIEKKETNIVRMTMSNLCISDLLKENFLKELENTEKETNSKIIPMTLALMYLPKNSNEKPDAILVMHDTPKDLQNKVVSITLSSGKGELLNKIAELLKKM